jgi:hypothetical protein
MMSPRTKDSKFELNHALLTEPLLPASIDARPFPLTSTAAILSLLDEAVFGRTSIDGATFEPRSTDLRVGFRFEVEAIFEEEDVGRGDDAVAKGAGGVGAE